MGVPLVLIHFEMEFSLINHPASWGYPPTSWKPPSGSTNVQLQLRSAGSLHGKTTDWQISKRTSAPGGTRDVGAKVVTPYAHHMRGNHEEKPCVLRGISCCGLPFCEHTHFAVENPPFF